VGLSNAVPRVHGPEMVGSGLTPVEFRNDAAVFAVCGFLRGCEALGPGLPRRRRGLQTFALADAEKAHLAIEARETVAKTLLVQG
jgi:hypothetical protein